MSQEVATIECDKCGTQVKRSKTIYDKGAQHPELIKKIKAEGKDHLELCPDCAGIETLETEPDVSDESLDEQLPNIRRFL